MAKAMVPISVIADLVVSELGDNTQSKKLLLMQYIALGFQQMNLLLNQDIAVKTFIIDVDGQNQFELDCSFIYETKVGIRKKGVNGKPPGKLATLKLNTDMEVSCTSMNDTDTMNAILSTVEQDECGSCDCYFYNSPCGTIRGHGRGYTKNNYYNIKDGVLNISPYLHKLGDDLELVVEAVIDSLTTGMTLVPSEAFLALYYFGRARYYKEGENGVNQLMYESNFKTLKRVYNFRSINELVDLYARGE